MKNRIISLLFFLIGVVAAISAQAYTVYSVIGTAEIIEGKSALPLKARKLIKAQTRLRIFPESSVTVLDEKSSKLYSFSSEGTFSVKQLIEKSQKKTKNVSKQYMSYLVKQLFSSSSSQMTHPDTYMQVTATSYRSASTDSMLVARLSQMLQKKNDMTTEQFICSTSSPLDTDMDVSFDLVSCDTGFLVERQTPAGTACYVRVHNYSEEALYVNVLDIDDQGNKYLVLPVDSATACAHLLVPSLTTVSFTSEPFIFSDGQSAETFMLVATPEPVDFSILMGPIRGGRKTMKSGFFKRTLQVR